MSVTHRIYMDNAATSFPKPEAVHDAMIQYARLIGASPGRGAYDEARIAGERLWQARERIAQLIGAERAEQIVFTLNASDALNLAIRGLLRPGDHVVTTWMEHNSVLRPLNHLVSKLGIEQTRVPCDPRTGLVDPADIQRALRPTTRLVAVVHGSNVTGTLQPVAAVGQITRSRGVPLLVDAAQTLGHLPLNVQAAGIDLLAFPGHKGLLGPLGTGGLYIRSGLERQMVTVREGGTGSVSELDVQPDFMPDRFEPGSHNAIGLIAMSEGVRWLLDKGVDRIEAHEATLIDRMLAGLATVPGLTLYGPPTSASRTGVFSVRVRGYDTPQDLSDVLEKRYGILTRPGLHCAPLAHRTVGTHELGGTTRFSLGAFLSVEDVDRAIRALHEAARLVR